MNKDDMIIRSLSAKGSSINPDLEICFLVLANEPSKLSVKEAKIKKIRARINWLLIKKYKITGIKKSLIKVRWLGVVFLGINFNKVLSQNLSISRCNWFDI